MKAMIIFLVFVMQSAAQLLFAQNLTIEVVTLKRWRGISMSPSTIRKKHS